MSKIFNVSADCKPNLHYMVDIKPKLEKIMDMVDKGQYFTINRARQYGKTTILKALGEFLKKDYTVVSLDFQMMSYEDFENEKVFVEAFAREIIKRTRRNTDIPNETIDMLRKVTEGTSKNVRLASLFEYFSEWCEKSEKPVVLIIDEVDSATNNHVFLDFLAQLRGYYINRDVMATFQSVILTGVYDVKNIKRKLRSDDEHKVNSPWNIAADFLVDLSFSAKDIAGMLEIRLYNMFLTLSEMQSSDMYRGALQNKNQFIQNGHLNMKMVLEKFVIHFNDIYGNKGQKFLEEDGRRYFLLYLRPIINGAGNYYIESQTRDMERTDVIVDYHGEQFIVELKIWLGNSYNTRGEAQLTGYLDYYHLEKGYMLSFSFIKNKQIGVKEITLGDKILVEAVV